MQSTVSSSEKAFAAIFGGFIAFVLLALYAYIVGTMIWEVIDAGRAEREAKEFAAGVITVVTTVGGLISALVVSRLAITTPGETPTLSAIATPLDGEALRPSGISIFMAILYLTVWVAVGLTSLVVGTVLFPGLNSTVSDIGTSWLGLAIAAGYAYFNIRPGVHK